MPKTPLWIHKFNAEEATRWQPEGGLSIAQIKVAKTAAKPSRDSFSPNTIQTMGRSRRTIRFGDKALGTIKTKGTQLQSDIFDLSKNIASDASDTVLTTIFQRGHADRGGFVMAGESYVGSLLKTKTRDFTFKSRNPNLPSKTITGYVQPISGSQTTHYKPADGIEGAVICTVRREYIGFSVADSQTHQTIGRPIVHDSPICAVTTEYLITDTGVTINSCEVAAYDKTATQMFQGVFTVGEAEQITPFERLDKTLFTTGKGEEQHESSLEDIRIIDKPPATDAITIPDIVVKEWGRGKEVFTVNGKAVQSQYTDQADSKQFEHTRATVKETLTKLPVHPGVRRMLAEQTSQDGFLYNGTTQFSKAIEKEEVIKDAVAYKGTAYSMIKSLRASPGNQHYSITSHRDGSATVTLTATVDQYTQEKDINTNDANYKNATRSLQRGLKTRTMSENPIVKIPNGITFITEYKISPVGEHGAKVNISNIKVKANTRAGLNLCRQQLPKDWQDFVKDNRLSYRTGQAATTIGKVLLMATVIYPLFKYIVIPAGKAIGRGISSLFTSNKPAEPDLPKDNAIKSDLGEIATHEPPTTESANQTKVTKGHPDSLTSNAVSQQSKSTEPETKDETAAESSSNLSAQ